MKKKIIIPIVIIVLLLVLFLPIPSGVYKDGGSRSYTSLTYKIVSWHRIDGANRIYDETKVYFFPKNFKSLDELWELEKQNIDYPTLKVEIKEIYEDSVIAEVIDNKEGQPRGQVSFGISKLENINVAIGDIVEVTYTNVMETYPTQMDVISWKRPDSVYVPFDISEWQDASSYLWGSIVEVDSDYLIVGHYHSDDEKYYYIRLNGDVGDWCVGDEVVFTFENAYIDKYNCKIKADLVEIESQPPVALKPVIYLYPEEKTEVTVNLNLNGRFTCTYPAYNDGWNVTASPDGTLTDQNGQTYNYLYWEGETNAQYDFSKGFCVKGEDTAQFLETALADLGLNRREANEFIVYWLPLMGQNPYNIISFQTDAYTDAAELNINPAPDTLIRVFMAWQASDTFVELPAQDLSAPERTGFTVIEWGGTEIPK